VKRAHNIVSLLTELNVHDDGIVVRRDPYAIAAEYVM
jgi:hypothetical protein